MLEVDEEPPVSFSELSNLSSSFADPVILHQSTRSRESMEGSEPNEEELESENATMKVSPA